MLTKQELEKRYFDTYGEKIIFDDTRLKGTFLISSEKGKKEKVLVGAGGVENERNSTTYYVFNTADNSEMRMKITSQQETEIPTGHIGKIAATTIELSLGKSSSKIEAYDVYIDTTDNTQLGALLTGLYPQAKYSTYAPQTEKLFSDWYNYHGEYSILKQKHEKYLAEEQKELQKNLKTACKFFVNFIGSKDDLKIAKETSSMFEKFAYFCKHLALRNKKQKIQTPFMHCTDNNRF